MGLLPSPVDIFTATRSYDLEPVTIGKMKALVAEEGLTIAIDNVRLHHEIYLSDPRKTAIDKVKTVIRYPVK